MHVGGSSKKLMKLCCGCPAQDDWRHIFLDQTWKELKERALQTREKGTERGERARARERKRQAKVDSLHKEVENK